MPDIEDISEVLPEDDVEFLMDKYPSHLVRQVGNEIHVLLRNFSLPQAYSPQVTDILLRLPSGYPNAAPDMFWTKPEVMLATGGLPLQCGHHEVPGIGPGSEVYAGIPWQRWSRHFEGRWIPGKHGLRSFVTTIIQELKRGV